VDGRISGRTTIGFQIAQSDHRREVLVSRSTKLSPSLAQKPLMLFHFGFGHRTILLTKLRFLLLHLALNVSVIFMDVNTECTPKLA